MAAPVCIFTRSAPRHSGRAFDDKSAPMKHQEEFAAAGMVSVWIGNFQTDVQFDNYMLECARKRGLNVCVQSWFEALPR